MYNALRNVVSAATLAMACTLAMPAQMQNTTTSQIQTQDWNTPPAGTEQAQQGYRDGLQAAQLDRAAKRPIDPKVSHLYVHPPVKGAARDEYRSSFAAGYNAAVQHASTSM